MPAAVPVIMAVGSKIAAGLAAAKTAVGGYIAAKGGALAAAKAAAVTVGKVGSAVGTVATGTKAIVDAAKGDKAESQAFDQEKANRKAMLQSANAGRRRIAQQTQTLLTSPLGGLGGVARTLLGQ